MCSSSSSCSSSRRFSSSDSVLGISASSSLVILGGKTSISMLSSDSETVNLSEPVSMFSGVAGGSSCTLSSLTALKGCTGRALNSMGFFLAFSLAFSSSLRW